MVETKYEAGQRGEILMISELFGLQRIQSILTVALAQGTSSVGIDLVAALTINLTQWWTRS